MNASLLAAARQLHRVPFFRTCARQLARGRTIEQRFHGGVICLDAVEHSWAWTGSRRLDDFERELQDCLLTLVHGRSLLIDIGCSIGVMTLSSLLRDAHVKTVSFDASPRVIELLNRSLHRNDLNRRSRTHALAVSANGTSLTFADGGSFTGHVAPTGLTIPAIPLAEIVGSHVTCPAVIKLDVEGYEALLADSLRQLPKCPGSVLVIELHPSGFNGFGDPLRVIQALQARGDMALQLLGGGNPNALDSSQFNQLEARWLD